MPLGERGRRRRRLTDDELATLVHWIARSYLEVQSGQRPMSALRGLLAGDLYLRLDRDMPRPCRTKVTADDLGATVVSRVGYDRVRGVVVVREGSERRALLVQLNRTPGHTWQVVELGILRAGALQSRPSTQEAGS